MPFTLKEGAETSGLPTISLAGEAYFVARLPLRRTIAIAALMPKVTPALQKVAAGAGDDADFAPMIEVVRQALLPLYPGLTSDELLDLPIDIGELDAALPVIVSQASSRRAVPAGEAEATSGAPTTGENSSQTSSSN
jgi:hypothetical protein